MITSFHHIGCLVPDIKEAIADYKVLHPEGELSPLYEIDEQKVNVQFFSIQGTYIEFVQPTSEQSSLFKLLKKNPGFYHIGIYTDNIDREIERLENEGYRKINKFRSAAFENRYCAFLYNLEMHLIELIEK